MSKTAVFAGSFDPITVGHESIVRRAMPLFDAIVIAIGSNTLKQNYFKLEKRKQMIRDVFADEEKISVDEYEGLTVDYCKKIGATYLLRGLRTSADFEYERAIAQLNKSMYPEVESVFLLTIPEHTPINSTIVRDIIRHGGDAKKFLPGKIDLKKYL
ncbi:MAG: pantetheine-phosphate adenylyltransferase [Bacteroidales bacterium]|nr:pantetheine-phosphate adenylyltransferase [Bacteroidales bacterium]